MFKTFKYQSLIISNPNFIGDQFKITSFKSDIIILLKLHIESNYTKTNIKC